MIEPLEKDDLKLKAIIDGRECYWAMVAKLINVVFGLTMIKF